MPSSSPLPQPLHRPDTHNPNHHENVFLFVPNLIGYARVGLWVASLVFLRTDAWIAMALYGVSGLLDAVDGHVARLLNQSSRFGAVLDMVTDRSATTALMVYLTTVYPAYTMLFQLLIALDLSSHYMQMVASLTLGLASHKSDTTATTTSSNVMTAAASYVLRLYYTNRTVLFWVCLGNEALFMALYVWSAGFRGMLVQAVVAVSLPVCVFKQVVNVVQLVGASRTLARADADTRRKGKIRAE